MNKESDLKKLCKMCLEPLTSTNKCEAHIMPRGLLKEMSGDEYGQLLIVGTDMKKKLHAPIGSYDTGILCRNCDNKLGVYDKYALKFVKMKNLTPHQSGMGWLIQGVDHLKLKLFCLSYLWRASITSRAEFDGVSLGQKHEELIRKLLILNNPGSPGEYTTIFSKFSSSEDKGTGMLMPAKMRINNLNYYEAYLPNYYKFWVRVDSQDDPIISKLSLGSMPEMFIHNRGNYNTSVERDIMVRAAKSSN